MSANLHRWGTGLLALWLAAGCIAVCMAETHAGAHTTSTQLPATSESCTDGCCQKDSGETPQPNHSGDAMECCLFLAAPPTTLAKKLNLAPAPALLAGVAPPIESALREIPSRSRYLPDGSGVFLRCRVLRI